MFVVLFVVVDDVLTGRCKKELAKIIVFCYCCFVLFCFVSLFACSCLLFCLLLLLLMF